MSRKKIAKLLSWLFFILIILSPFLYRANLLTLRWVLMLQNLLLFCTVLANRLLHPPQKTLSRLVRVLDWVLLLLNPVSLYFLVFRYLD